MADLSGQAKDTVEPLCHSVANPQTDPQTYNFSAFFQFHDEDKCTEELGGEK